MKKNCVFLLCGLMMCAANLSAQLKWNCGAEGNNVTATFDGSTLTISGTGEMENYVSYGLEQNLSPWHEYSASITAVIIKNGITSIGSEAFRNCNLTSVTIPGSVTSIGDGAFYELSGLTSVTIPSSVTTIGNSAFSKCNGLTSVTIPNSVKTIDHYAFSECTGLTSVIIPNSVKTIGWGTFFRCSGLTSVTIPGSVTSIGSYAFQHCSNLKKIINYATTPPQIDGLAFDSVNKTTCVLRVPANWVSIYRAHKDWGEFVKIEGIRE